MSRRVESIEVQVPCDYKTVKVINILEQCTHEELEMLFMELFSDEDILNMLDKDSITDYFKRNVLTP